jgi:hypothetical protein
VSHNSPTYYERFREAFVAEVNAFADSVLDDTGEICWRFIVVAQC